MASRLEPLDIHWTEGWRIEWCHSGTMNVKHPGSMVWLYVYGPGNENETEYVRDRWQCCEDIVAFLNGGQKPIWLDDLYRVSDEHAEALDKTSITVCGPMIDSMPPKCHWVCDESENAKMARKRLMDRLFSKDAPCLS